MAWCRSRATSTTSRETSSDDADDADADDADALDVEVEVAVARVAVAIGGVGRAAMHGGGACLVVIGRWGRVIHSKRGVRNDWTTGRRRAHTKKRSVGRGLVLVFSNTRRPAANDAA